MLDQEPKITLDPSTFKALASGTRVKILKTLEKRNHTQSELSAVLKMSIPTIKDHLKEMEKGGLVKRKEEGRKWIYYSLTERSKCILNPERKRLWIVLSFFILSAIGTVFTLSKYFGKTVARKTFAAPLARGGGVPEMMLAKEEAITAAQDSAATAVNEAVIQTAQTDPLLYITIAISAITIILLILTVYYLKKSNILKKH